MKTGQRSPNAFTFRNDLRKFFQSDLPGELSRWLVVGRYYLVLLPLLVILVVGFVLYLEPIPTRKAYLGTGQPGSSYHLLSQRIHAYFSRYGINLELVETPGLDQGLKELNDDKFDVSASFLTAGSAKPGQYPKLVSLGSIQYSPLWLFYKGASYQGDDPLVFLRDKKVAIGLEGTNTRKMLVNLMEASGLKYESRPNFLEISHYEAVEQFEQGKIDAVLLLDGIDAPNVQRLLAVPDVNIFDFNLVDAYVKKMPYLEKLVIPRGSLNIGKMFPDKKVDMLSSTVTLLVEEDTHPVIQWIFLMAAKDISGDWNQFFAKPGFFPAYLDRTVPLSNVAHQYYSTGIPAVFNYFPIWVGVLIDRFWVLILTIIALGYPFMQMLSAIRNYPSQKLLSFYYDSLWSLEEQILSTTDLDHARTLQSNLLDLQDKIIKTWFDDGERKDFYTLKRRLEGVRDTASDKVAELEAKQLR